MEKERRTKALLLSTLVVVVATLSIAFAAMSRTLSINGIGKMDTASWSVYFDNLSNAKITRGAHQISAPSISADKGTVQDINVKLSNPKDEISYTVDIVNDGTIDAEITMIKDVELTDVQKKVFEFKVFYTDTNEVLKDGDLLPADTTKNITITIRFKDDITEFDLPSQSQTINLSYQITYTQYDGGNIPIIPDGGDITTGKAVLAHDINALMSSDDPSSTPFFNGTLGRGSVESISFLNSSEVPSDVTSIAWDASEAGDASIMAWYQEGATEGLYDVYIGCNNKIYLPSDCTALFMFFMNLKQINNIQLLDTSDVTNMFYFFAACASLTSLDLSSFDTSKVTDMSYMFTVCGNLTTLILDNWDTTSVTTMELMFDECLSLTSLDVSSFNTSNVTNMLGMFIACESLTNIDLSSFDTSNVTTMESMFNGCRFESLDLSNFVTSNVTNMSRMFQSCENLTEIKINSAVFNNDLNSELMFSGVSSNPTIYVKDEVAKTFILSVKSDANVIVEPLNS